MIKGTCNKCRTKFRGFSGKKATSLKSEGKEPFIEKFPSSLPSPKGGPKPNSGLAQARSFPAEAERESVPGCACSLACVRSLLRVLLAVRLDKPDCPGAHVFSSILSEKWKEVTYFCFVTGVSFLLALPCGMQDLNSWVRNLMGVLGESAESCPWTSREALGSWF